MEPKKKLSFRTRVEWRKWLQKNHNMEEDVWVILCKKHVSNPRLQYDDAVEEAICFGWIDSKMKRIDDDKFIQRFSPRKPGSIWSKLNKERAKKMMQIGLMKSSGLAKIEEAKQSGKWDSAYTSREKPDIPKDLKDALVKNKKAWENFNNFTNSQQLMYIYWVDGAKRQDTRERRIRQVVIRSARNERPG